MLNPYASPRLPPESKTLSAHRWRSPTQVFLADICWQLPLAVLILLCSQWLSTWGESFYLILKVVGLAIVAITLMLSIVMWRRREQYLEVAGRALCGIVFNVLMLLFLGASLTFIVQEWFT